MGEKKDFNVDEALKRLEEINTQLSAEGITLEDSLKLYEEGTLLAKKCKDHLVGVEKQIKVINE